MILPRCDSCSESSILHSQREFEDWEDTDADSQRHGILSGIPPYHFEMQYAKEAERILESCSFWNAIDWEDSEHDSNNPLSILHMLHFKMIRRRIMFRILLVCCKWNWEDSEHDSNPLSLFRWWWTEDLWSAFHKSSVSVISNII